MNATWSLPRSSPSGDRGEDAARTLLDPHALTGDPHVATPSGPGQPTPGWRDGLIGPGRALDPARWFVLAPNVLGGCPSTPPPASPPPAARPPAAGGESKSRREHVTTDAPSVSSVAAIDLPIPTLPPVTIATLPEMSNFDVIRFPLFEVATD